MTLRPVAVFDIDGVVADVRHRLHHLAGPRKDWMAFFAAADQDPPLAAGQLLVGELAADHDIVWLTGRPERLRTVTKDWLLAAGLPAGRLLMRGNHDRRPAALTKAEHLLRLSKSRSIALVVDDDPDVIAALRETGLPVTLADWVPHGPTLRAAQERDGRT